MIRLVVTRGYGNGTFNGTVADVATRGYTIDNGVVVSADQNKQILFLADVGRLLR